MGLDTGDRLETNARKLKFLVRTLPDDSKFPPFEDFDVIHDYMQTNSKKTQARLRKRGQKGNLILEFLFYFNLFFALYQIVGATL